MLQIKDNTQTLSCKQKQRCGWLGPFKCKVVCCILCLLTDRSNDEMNKISSLLITRAWVECYYYGVSSYNKWSAGLVSAVLDRVIVRHTHVNDQRVSISTTKYENYICTDIYMMFSTWIMYLLGYLDRYIDRCIGRYRYSIDYSPTRDRHVSGIHRERNHGATRSTRPITVHERTAIYKSQLLHIIENPGNTRGGNKLLIADSQTDYTGM